MNVDLIMRKAAQILESGETEKCISFLEAHLAKSRAAADLQGVGTMLCALGEIFAETGETSRARPLLEELLKIEADDLLELERRRAEELLREI